MLKVAGEIPFTLCNDRAVLGPWVNRPWLNVVGTIIVGLLVMLSLILATTTLFPSVDATRMALVLSVMLALGLGALGLAHLVQRQPTPGDAALSAMDVVERATWRMPPLATLPRPVWSTSRKLGMLAMRAYLLSAMALMLIKVLQLALGH